MTCSETNYDLAGQFNKGRGLGKKDGHMIRFSGFGHTGLNPEIGHGIALREVSKIK